MFSILLSSAGRRVELLRCFREAARELNISLRVVATDANPRMSAACAEADLAFEVPPCADPSFVPALLNICRSEKIRLLIPTIDPELEPLASSETGFREIGTKLAISSSETISMARNKLLTHEFFKNVGIPTPRTDTLEALCRTPENWRFPVVLKPVSGSSSVGVRLAHSRSELESLQHHNEGYIAQEHWSGAEYTVNLFFDHSGLRCAIPHRRIEVRAGEVSKGVTERVPALSVISEQLGHALAGKAFGPLCFQAIVGADGTAAAFELNARFGGGYPLAHKAGAEFTKWLLELATVRSCSAHDNWREGVLMLRYDAAVFKTEKSSV